MLGWWPVTAASWDPRLLAVVAAALLLSGSLTLWIRFFWRATEGLPMLRYEPRRAVPWTIVDLSLLFIVFLAASLAFWELYAEGAPPTVWRHAASRGSPPPAGITTEGLLANLGAQMTVLLVALVGLRAVRGATPVDWGLVSTHVGRDLWIAVVAAVALLPPVYALQALAHQVNDTPHPIIRALTDSGDPRLLTVACISAGLLAPVWEELFFRVLFQGWLERVLMHPKEPAADSAATPDLALDDDGTGQYAPVRPQPRGGWLPIAISAAVFAGMHQDFESPRVDILPLFVFACGLGYVYQRTHRAWPSILLHMALNICSLTALLLTLPAR